MKQSVLNDLKQKYGCNYPIFLSDFPDPDSDATRQYVSRCCREGKIQRFMKGIYYFSTITRWGESRLSPIKVCERKYINNGNQVCGYISGTSFENEAGFTTQMPDCLTIRTNNTASRCEKLLLKGQKVVIKRSRVPVNAVNQKELQFLDLLNDMPETEIKENQNKLRIYIKSNSLSKSVIQGCVPFYPSKVSKIMIQGGFYDLLT